MSSIKTVVVAGASGNVGMPTVHSLISAGFTVTALVRDVSKTKFPSGVIVKSADYSSLSELKNVLTGQDAVVCTLGPFAMTHQKSIIEAAAAVGVKKFIPCEFSANMSNDLVRAMPLYSSKLSDHELLATKYQEMGMEYSLINTGPFIDWSLRNNFIADLKAHTVAIYDGGNQEWSGTRLSDVAKAITGCLVHTAETKNRSVYSQSIIMTPNKVLALARNVEPNVDWVSIDMDTKEKEQQSLDALAAGDYSMNGFYGFIVRAQFGGPEYGQPWIKSDSELLGIKQMTDKDLEIMMREIKDE